MGSSRVVKASDCYCQSRNSLGFDPSILGHTGVWGAADETVFIKENIEVHFLAFYCSFGYLQVSEAYIDYAQKCDVIFGAQRDIALQIPDVADRDIQVICLNANWYNW